MATCRFDAAASETLVKAETIAKADGKHLQRALLALHAVGGLFRFLAIIDNTVALLRYLSSIA